MTVSKPVQLPAIEFAFPQRSHSAPSGMTLRDYFAAQAMQGALAMEGGEIPLTAFESVDVQAIADACYETADAMLAAREKRDG